MSELAFYTDFFSAGNDVLIKGRDRNGESILKRVEIDPTLYTSAPELTTYGRSQYTTLDATPLYMCAFNNVWDAHRAIKEAPKGTMFGNTRFEYSTIDAQFPDGCELNLEHVVTAYIDIEAECENGFPRPDNPIERVNAVTVICRGKTFCLALGDHTPADDVRFMKCHTEKDLFDNLAKLIAMLDIDVISGWFVDIFDIPYLIERSKVLYGGMTWAKKLSPWGIVHDREVEVMGSKQTVYEIRGVLQLDYKQLYESYGPKQPSYSLGYISQVELGDTKVEYDGTIKEFYTTDFNKFVEYNIHDARLVMKLDEKLHFIDLAIQLALKCKVKLADIFMQTRMWETMIYNYLKRTRNIIAPVKTSTGKGEGIEGAYVHDPQPAMYDWVMSYDVTSLYPSLFMQYNISPETMIGKHDIHYEDLLDDTDSAKEAKRDSVSRNATLAANGAMFRKDVGFLPEMVEALFKERKVVKKKMLEVERKQNEIKKILEARRANG